MVALCSILNVSACGQVSSPRLYRLIVQIANYLKSWTPEKLFIAIFFNSRRLQRSRGWRYLKHCLRVPSIVDKIIFILLSPILLPIEEALYAFDHLRAKIRYKKIFLGREENLEFENFDDEQVDEIIEQADTFKTIITQKSLLATRETQVVQKSKKMYPL